MALFMLIGIARFRVLTFRPGIGENMSKVIAALVVAAAVLYTVVFAEAQQPTKVPRLGFLNAGSPSAIAARLEAFQQGLRELGYVDGKALSSSIDRPRGKQIGFRSLRSS